MNAYAKIADFVGVERLFVQMFERRFEADESIYRTLMDAFARALDLLRSKYSTKLYNLRRSKLVMQCLVTTSAFSSEWRRH